MTSTSMSSLRCAASCAPRCTRAPSRSSRRVVSLSTTSEPDDVAEGEQHLRDTAHPDPADADEVDPALAPVHRRAPQAGQPEPPAPIPDPALKPHHARSLLENRAVLFKGSGSAAQFCARGSRGGEPQALLR